ncbi:Uncharacterized conserved protein YukE [Lachnospiraceae bacterium XBB2008]|nr:Uncharacterized conserved protein YukE [Lachnospiraceae bacterium XBB2008]
MELQYSDALQGIIDQLIDLNTQFKKDVTRLDDIQKGLVVNWEGEASTTFQNKYMQEKECFTEFAQVIDDAAQILQRILDNARRTENLATAISAGSGS